jgi:hypothetical protein
VSVNSRTKGKAFEQAIARDLREWLGEDWLVERNQTDRQRGATGTAGEFSVARRDLGSGPPFAWCIECKAHAAWDEGQLWRSPVVGPLPGWWVQARRQASAVQLKPVLVAKRDRGEVLAFVRASDWHDPVAPPWLYLKVGEDWVLGMRWATWLSLASP